MAKLNNMNSLQYDIILYVKNSDSYIFCKDNIGKATFFKKEICYEVKN